jgi:LCP family protein required for cell wall assembly
MRASKRRPSSPRKPIPGWLIWVFGGAFAAGAIVSVVLVFTAARGLTSAWTGTGPAPFTFADSGAPAATDAAPAPATQVAPESPAPEWNGSDRVTGLLMGLDYRDWSKGDGPPRTDSMMLVTVDPVAHTAGMLSIPRDLWVEIPGFEHGRINTAYFLGETYQLPGGGPELAVSTVENVIGVPIDFYAVIDFTAFEEMINELGGLDMQVQEEIKICPISRPCRVLSPQSLHFNGADTLAYARARKTSGGDFDRAQRQQQVALAIRDKILNLNMVSTIVSKAPALYQDLAAGIRTNLGFEQMLSLGLVAVQTPKDRITTGVIAPPDMVTLETLPDGAQVLKPIPERIRELRDTVFTDTGAIAPSVAVAAEDPSAAAKQENPRVRLLNGAGVEGLATQTADYLKAQGVDIVEVANADRLDYEKSRIIVYNRTFPYTTAFLADLLGMSQSQILNPLAPTGDVDLDVIIGYDWAQYVISQGGLN